MSTYRERREARAERLQEWAAKREVKAQADALQASRMAQAIPFGQPILVGHHSEGRDRRFRARIGATMDRAIENERKAQSMASRADGIRSQLDGAIYDDDPDALQQLEARIAALEAERDAIKAYNASCRKGAPNSEGLNERQRSHYADHIAKALPFPPYVLQNLGGNITRNRQRLEQVKRLQARQERTAQAGGLLIERREHYAVVTFAEKPERETIEALKAAGFRWGKGSWVGRADALPEGLDNE
jgi:hypothetical protein